MQIDNHQEITELSPQDSEQIKTEKNKTTKWEKKGQIEKPSLDFFFPSVLISYHATCRIYQYVSPQPSSRCFHKRRVPLFKRV